MPYAEEDLQVLTWAKANQPNQVTDDVAEQGGQGLVTRGRQIWT